MKKIICFLFVGLLLSVQADAARGRKPCSGAKGGISHCTSDGRFVCNDGSLSQSKRFCSGYGVAPDKRQVKSPVTTKPVQKKKSSAVRKVSQPSVAEKDESVPVTEPRKPTCAPLYMASKPGFTHLPICSGNQY
ncbi:TPA: hypothetical protein RPO43_004270, partial [Escherichia coli]|nr:hypothetical protein [Escherichia coli]